jgi:hypothetical protein
MEIVMLMAGAAWAGSIPVLTGAWWFERRRARRKNEEGRCSACSESWTDLGEPERYLIHGSLVCEGCAEATRGRILGHFGLLGGAGVFASAAVFLSQGATLFSLFPISSVAVMGAGAVALMKRANRKAEAEIAAGTYPALRPPVTAELTNPTPQASPGG